MHVSCAWLLFSVVTFSVSLSFPPVQCWNSTSGKPDTLSGLAGAITAGMWQLLEKHSYLLLIFEGLSAAIAVAC